MNLNLYKSNLNFIKSKFSFKSVCYIRPKKGGFGKGLDAEKYFLALLIVMDVLKKCGFLLFFCSCCFCLEKSFVYLQSKKDF